MYWQIPGDMGYYRQSQECSYVPFNRQNLLPSVTAHVIERAELYPVDLISSIFWNCGKDRRDGWNLTNGRWTLRKRRDFIGNAKFIVTGDSDLLDLEGFQDVRITTASEFLDNLSEISPSKWWTGVLSTFDFSKSKSSLQFLIYPSKSLAAAMEDGVSLFFFFRMRTIAVNPEQVQVFRPGSRRVARFQTEPYVRPQTHLQFNKLK